ncbi:NADP-dependent oxidoreductase [Candidatus Enterococcus courvalinii]|uniref:NADP-dependent oxidoreductase n=1 Tax=Candidatus Enterococcus courvalinii TaxID=2815329 RepID=A0ABS3HZ52_9ENTE|nr:NADP-dependent oxidoreductase [Enterococcus sp. MSG2901]MBO0481743.1 NADP-dependent oxidoreductase [Enterococcus sp. MSG2901]
MKALQYENFGGPEVLSLVDIPEPATLPNTIKVKVAAIGLNPMDWLIMSNEELAKNFGVQLPQIYGYDYSGEIEEVWSSDSPFKVGDRVFGSTMKGSAAEYILVDPAEINLIPDNLSDEIAATISIAGSTAIDVIKKASITSTDTVLIGGAAGGVGVFAIQLAKLKGASVIGTASDSTRDFLTSFGVKQVAYGKGLTQRVAGEKITAAIDLYSHEVINTAIELGVSVNKMATVIGFPMPPEGVSYATGSNTKPEEMEMLANQIASGDVTVPIEKTYSISEFEKAIQNSMDRHIHGKLVLHF